MCGRYALALRPSQVRQMLEDDDMSVDDAPEDEGEGSPRQSYNFAPGYHGVVYRADTPDRGAGNHDASVDGHDHPDATAQKQDGTKNTRYKLQSIKWGLIPFWTKRNPEYSNMMKTINGRDDSLAQSGGMWASMKARKRCIVVAQGFFEWLKTGPKDKLPHFVKRRDGHLMCFAGLWDCVQYEGSVEKHYTYTIITTDSNKQLKFLHDRMPVILDLGSDSLKTWLDPCRSEWGRGLQSLLRPFDGDLDVYPVSKDVGKVGNNLPSFIIPLDSKENKSNIANFFANASPKKQDSKRMGGEEVSVKKEEEVESQDMPHSLTTPETGPVEERDAPAKRKAFASLDDDVVAKKIAASPIKGASPKKISAIKNNPKRQKDTKAKGSQKITNFFSAPNSA